MLVSERREDHHTYLLGLDYIKLTKMTISSNNKLDINLEFES